MSRPTPHVRIDRAVLERNIDTMQRAAGAAGLALRPHAKTHKSLEVARLQLAAGAVGLTVATVSEAEVFAAVCDDLVIAYPLWMDDERAGRLRGVLERAAVAVGVDSVESVRRLAPLADAGLRVRVEVDSGHHRSGVPAGDVVAVASAATEVGLLVDGVFTFPGHSYSPDARASAAADEQRELAAARDVLVAAGIPCPTVSGGSTPSVAYARGEVLTEVRPGVYVFGDAQQWELGTIAPEQVALTVVATVVGHYPDRVVLDAGSKVLGADRSSWATGHGRFLDHPDAVITALSEHHATVTGFDAPRGTRVRVVPNHVCTAVNLADDYAVDDATWRVDARNANT
ncbi:alanine racemase [Nocardioides sp. Root122]|uniref:alanine racemase n=1 Tax=Nocardioides TaxID=1839 RepID=UPI000702C81C|nr:MULTISPECIES: alanine racemase [Nocardioides]KQV71319.1 alanine racemase [Nocardioides sp. Root122]MCK9822727.1 alanine racemase [Nocardioides cavernae]